MDYAPSECRLIRSFSEGNDQVTLQLSRLDVDDLLEMALAGPRMPATAGESDVAVSTSTVSQVPGMHASGYAAAKNLPGIIRFRPDRDLPNALRSDVAANQQTRLSIKFARRYSVQLELGSMKEALSALDKCMNNLISTWGLDPVEQRQRASAPEPADDPVGWFRPKDYPASLSRSGMGGIVVMRLIVGADGSVKDCDVAKAGGDKKFEDLTCQLATSRARFRPAVGASGKPIASVWIRRINWQPATPFIVQRS
jgi:TonB family protein